MGMRVATWNCQKDVAKQWDTLEGLDVDVIAVQECSEATQAKAEEHGCTSNGRGAGHSTWTSYLFPRHGPSTPSR